MKSASLENVTATSSLPHGDGAPRTSPRSRLMVAWQKHRSGRLQWFVECVAEAMCTFLYTYAGVGSQAAYVLGNILGLPNLGSILQTGIAYAVGIAIAVAICLPTSRGHANPAFTIYAVVFRRCEPLRGARLIVAQILGTFIACLLVYVQYHNLLTEAIAVLKAKGTYDALMFTSSGPGGIFGFYATPGANLGPIFLNEFVSDFVLGIIFLGSCDPTNVFVPPVMVPWIIGSTYAIVVWGFAPVGLATTSARDVGGRLAALALFGTPASGGRYAAIPALASIPATLLAGVFYEFILADSTRPVAAAHREMVKVHGEVGEDESM